MNRGDRVEVMLAGGDKAERRVWEEREGGVLICTAKGYEEAERTGREPPVIGFRREYVHSLPVE